MSGRWRMFRYAAGRALMHAGLRLMPPGRVRSELYQLLELWGTKVTATVREQASAARRKESGRSPLAPVALLVFLVTAILWVVVGMLVRGG